MRWQAEHPGQVSNRELQTGNDDEGPKGVTPGLPLSRQL
jgi:hypothetical protein